MQAKENLGRYSGVVQCATDLVMKEGPLALYTGLESHLWRNAAWNGESFVHQLAWVFPGRIWMSRAYGTCDLEYIRCHVKMQHTVYHTRSDNPTNFVELRVDIEY